MMSKSHAGFTLLETMVAISIMAIVLVAVFRLHSQSIALTDDALFNTQAPLLAQGKLAEYKSNTDTKRLLDDRGDFGDEFPGYGWEVTIGEPEIDNLLVKTGAFKTIEVAVTFNTDAFVYRLKTYRFTN
jgi:general secretion pathway protein I